MKEIVSRILEGPLQLKAKGLDLVKLHGDASYRAYWRASLPQGKSFVIMQLPAGRSSVSEEITNLSAPPKELPFINIARYLKAQRLPVPDIVYCAKEDGLIFLEDLGDLTLEKILLRADQKEQEVWYRNAIDLLVLFQKQSEKVDRDCIAFQRSFDETLYNWEFDHFFEYGIEARLSKPVEAEDRNIFFKWSRTISTQLTRLPQGLTHRDFQSRNLMVQNGSLRLIDFQDALLGPRQYDLVALLRDSYIELEWPLVERLIDYYLDRTQGSLKGTEDRVVFKKHFDWVTIQRKLKDAGRFVYIDRVKKNPSFLKHIPASLHYVEEALERHPELKSFLELLKKYVPEFS